MKWNYWITKFTLTITQYFQTYMNSINKISKDFLEDWKLITLKSYQKIEKIIGKYALIDKKFGFNFCK